MKETPILFTGPMVRAILDGRKTQTRRVVKPQPLWPAFGAVRIWKDAKDGQAILDDDVCLGHVPKIVYKPGDRLWVKENCWIAQPNFGDADLNNCQDYDGRGRYVGYSASMDADSVRCAKDYGVKQSPSIFMFRWASRITLELTAVRVERVQDISEEDAMAEGVDWQATAGLSRFTAKKLYATLWDSINGKKHSWASNPWVWVLTFKRI